METKWLRSGEVVSVGGKVYGFRVDNVHNTAYKMLGNLQRGAFGDVEMEGEEEGKNEEELNEKKTKRRRVLFKEGDGSKTLEENDKHICIKKYDMVNMVDPLFKKTTGMFDDNRPSSIFTANSSVTPSLLLKFDSSMSDLETK